jgi:hypothetical protein
MAALEPELPLRVPVWIGDGDAATTSDSSRPIPATRPRRRARRAADRGRGRRGASRRPPRRSRLVATPGAQRAEILVRAAAWLREPRPSSRRWRCASAPSRGRGRRRRLRGDRLPRVLRARRDRARRGQALFQVPASATRCATRRAASSR